MPGLTLFEALTNRQWRDQLVPGFLQVFPTQRPRSANAILEFLTPEIGNGRIEWDEDSAVLENNQIYSIRGRAVWGRRAQRHPERVTVHGVAFYFPSPNLALFAFDAFRYPAVINPEHEEIVVRFAMLVIKCFDVQNP